MLSRFSIATICATLLLLPSCAARADLVAGDLAVVGFAADSPDEWTLLALAAIPAGETIYITDQGWDNSAAGGAGDFGSGEGLISLTTQGTGIAAGTVIHSGTLFNTNASWIAAGTSTLDLSSSGDQLLIYQTSGNSDTRPVDFIYGFNNDGGLTTSGGWLQDILGIGSSSSHLPSGSNANGATEVTTDGGAGNFFGLIGEVDNAYYSGPTDAADKDTWLTRIHTEANWTTNDSRFGPGFDNGASLSTLVFGGASSVDVTAVPEPSALFFGGVASILASCGWRVRRRSA